MKTATRPQYHRLQRILELIREGTRTGSLPNCGHFIRELEVSRRSLMRDLDFLRDDHHAPIAYDDSRKGFYLTDPTFSLPAGAMPPGRLPRQLVPFGAQHCRWPQGNLCPLALPLPRRHRAALPEPRRVRPESGRIREPLVLRRSADFSRLILVRVQAETNNPRPCTNAPHPVLVRSQPWQARFQGSHHPGHV